MKNVLNAVKNVCFSKAMYRLIRFLLGSVFVYAGMVKLMDVQGFTALIGGYGLVPPGSEKAVAIGLPLVEVMAGLGLVFDFRFSLSAIAIMLAVFLFVLWFGILKDLHIDCGCFSTSELGEQDALRKAFHRDLIMIGMCAYLFAWRWRHKPTPQEHVRGDT